MAKGIRELAFAPAHGDAAKVAMGFEVFRLSQLFERFARHEQDHPKDAPLRFDFHVVYVGLRGQGRVVIDFDPVPLGAGWLTVLARGQVHQYVLSGKQPDAWMLLFFPEFLATGARDVDPLRGSQVLAGRGPVALRLSAADRRELLGLCEQLAGEFARPHDALQAPLLASLLRSVLLRAERLARASGPATRLPAELQRFFTILERDALTTRSVAHYARAVGVSPRRLGELVQAHLGRSSKQAIDERVLLESRRLLAHAELSVKELADRVGFDEPTNFVKFFRLHAGVTPLAFRARFHHAGAGPHLAAPRGRR